MNDSRTPASGRRDSWHRRPMTRHLKPGKNDSRGKEMSMVPNTSEGSSGVRSGKTQYNSTTLVTPN